MRSHILGAGFYVPPRVVTNFDLEKMFETSDEWIQQRTGIVERRYVDEGMGTADLGYQASLKAIKSAGLEPKDIDFIIFATLSPDFTFPGSGVLLQEKLGIDTVGALDIRDQCSGFLYGLSLADQYVRTGTYKRILLVGAEVHSTGLEFATSGRDVTVIFGDGAGAVVVGPSPDPERGVLSVHLHSEGKYARDLWCEGPASILHPRIDHKMLDEGRHYPRMKGRMVFTHAVKRMPEVLMEALEKENLKVEDIDLLVMHQANLRINQFVANALGIPEEKVYNNIQRYGNTTAATLPICLAECLEQGRLKKGDLLAFVTFGAGFTWASALVRW